MDSFFIAYSLCGTHIAHTNCRLKIPPLRFGICKYFLALASPNLALSRNIRAKARMIAQIYLKIQSVASGVLAALEAF